MINQCTILPGQENSHSFPVMRNNRNKKKRIVLTYFEDEDEVHFTDLFAPLSPDLKLITTKYLN